MSIRVPCEICWRTVLADDEFEFEVVICPECDEEMGE